MEGATQRLPNCTVRWVAAVALIAAASLTACVAGTGKDMTSEAKQRKIDDLVARYQAKYADVPGIDPSTLRAMLDEGSVVLVDVRTDEERATSMIAGAIASDEFERRAEELEGASVVTYCTIGYRSAGYAQELRQRGWDAKNLDGSILAWTHADGDLVDPEGRPTRKVHVYGKRWNLAADDYEAVW